MYPDLMHCQQCLQNKIDENVREYAICYMNPFVKMVFSEASTINFSFYLHKQVA